MTTGKILQVNLFKGGTLSVTQGSAELSKTMDPTERGCRSTTPTR